MDHFEQIYSGQAADYHRMIAAEDVDGNILSALEAITPFEGKRILDLGTGTGRLALLLHRFTPELVGLDLHAAMLHQNAAERGRLQGDWRLVHGDMRRLPIAAAWADVTLAGWAIGHMRGWFGDTWQTHAGQSLLEMQRVTATGGWLVILETLGTGSLEPAAPTMELEEYYRWLEESWGFTRRAIRTDYQFESVEQAIQGTEFFFGPELSALIRRSSWARIPEWTGVWFSRNQKGGAF